VIVLDTNVVSALMQRHPDAGIVAWLDAVPPESVWITSVTVLEIRFGLDLLADGRKRMRLEEAFSKALSEDLEDRILAFDRSAAEIAGAIAATQRRRGRPVEFRDLQIAGIVAARKATLATRNTRHFEDLGIPLVDPWAART
jgi:predicted nucleic acid-binding protein